MWALIPLLLIADVRPRLEFDPHHRHGYCESVEINRVVNGQTGTLNFIIVVFWGENGRVCDWMYYRQDNFRIHQGVVIWKDRDLTYFVHYSKMCFKTTTPFDREVEDRKIVKEEDRDFIFTAGKLNPESCKRGIP